MSIFFVFALTMVSAHPVSAQGDDTDGLARAHFDAGTAYYQTGDYDGAIREFRLAFDISGRSELRYNLYLAYERLGNLDEAISNLRAYLDTTVEIRDRATLEARVRNLEARRDRLNAEPTTETPEDATETDPDDDDESSSESTFEEGAPRRRNVGAIVSFSAGGLGVAMLSVFGGLALSEDRDLASTCGRDAGRSCTDAEVRALRGFTISADVGLGLAVAGAVSGLLFVTVWAPEDEPETSVAVAPMVGPGAVGVEGRVRFR